MKRQSRASGVGAEGVVSYSHSFDAIVPEDIEGWKAEANKIAGRTIYTARRAGITFVIVRDAEGWWSVEKIHQGRSVCHIVTKHPPERVKRVVLATLRRNARAADRPERTRR